MDAEHKILLKNIYACLGGGFRAAAKRLQGKNECLAAAIMCEELAKNCHSHYLGLGDAKAQLCVPYPSVENGHRLWNPDTGEWGSEC